MAEKQQPELRDQSPQPGSEKRKPILAFFGAVVSPGLGHLYSGRPVAALLWAALAVFAAPLFFFAVDHWNSPPVNVIIPFAVLLLFYPAQIVHAILVSRRQPASYTREWYNRWYYYVAWHILILVLLIVSPTASGYQAFHHPSASMENTLLVDDYVLADMSAYADSDPLRGDLVIFIFPGDGQTRYLKRCVGLPGDTIEVVDKQVLVNGVPEMKPPTIKHIDTAADGSQVIMARRPGRQNSRDNFGPYVVPEGAFFMMGDNRDNSYDSRYWRSVPRSMLLGKIKRIYYSSDRDRIGIAVE